MTDKELQIIETKVTRYIENLAAEILIEHGRGIASIAVADMFEGRWKGAIPNLMYDVVMCVSATAARIEADDFMANALKSRKALIKAWMQAFKRMEPQ